MAEKVLEWLLNIITNPLFVIGLLFVFLASYLKDEESVKSKAAKPAKFFKNELRPLPKLAYLIMIAAGILVALIGVLQVGGVIPLLKSSNVINPAPNVHLVNVGYMTEGWRPILIDLRTSNTNGVALYPGQLLRLLDVRVSSPEQLDGSYKVQAEAYANDSDLMGKTVQADLSPNITELGEIIPMNFKHPTETTNWQAQSDWNKITIYVVLYDGNGKNVISKEKTTIKLIQSENRSWWFSPPYAKFVSIVYQINNGEKISMDFRTIESEGININPGDTLQISEIWYHSMENSNDQQIIAIAYFNPGPATDFPQQSTREVNISSGVHNLIQDDSFKWNFKTIQDQIIIGLYRFDGFERYTRLDEYIIPIKPGSPNGLIPLSTP